MSIITVILVIAIVGFILWAVNSLIPMQDTVKKVLNIAVVVFLILWLLNIMGAFSYLREIRI
jgi:hypothetical protein